jgi:ribonuclease P protein component
MLPPPNRLRDSREIQVVFQKGKTMGVGWLLLKFYRNPQRLSRPPRLAFVVGLKFSKKAVERNRAKRVLREATRDYLEYFPQGCDGVFFLNKQATPEEVTYQEAKDKIRIILSKISGAR